MVPKHLEQWFSGEDTFAIGWIWSHSLEDILLVSTLRPWMLPNTNTVECTGFLTPPPTKDYPVQMLIMSKYSQSIGNVSIGNVKGLLKKTLFLNYFL